MTRTWKWALLPVVGMMTVGAGCASTKSASKTEIKDDWVARVPSEQLGPVNQAREAERAAKDEVTRAEVAVKDAQNELGIVKSRHKAAEAQLTAEKALVKAEQSKGQRQGVAEAEGRLQKASLNAQAFHAQESMAHAKIEALEAAKELADAKVKMHGLEVDRAEYQVLREHNDTHVQAMDPLAFDSALAEHHKDMANREAELTKKESELRAAQQHWERANQRLQAAGSYSPAG